MKSAKFKGRLYKRATYFFIRNRDSKLPVKLKELLNLRYANFRRILLFLMTIKVEFIMYRFEVLIKNNMHVHFG